MLLFVYTCICIVVCDQIIKRGIGIILASLTSRYFSPCPKTGPWFPTIYVVIFSVCIQGIVVRGDWSLCWYWWNCSPSLLKLSFHNKWNNPFLSIWGLSWSWSYCMWIYSYLCNQCLSLDLFVRIQLMARCTRCDFM